MRRCWILFFAVFVPLQFFWSAASAYCQHETTEQQASHFGHHFHAHEGDEKKSPVSKLAADADCASCHAAGNAAMAAKVDIRDVLATAMLASPSTMPPFSSALARAPDRPQWLRLV